MKLLMNNYDESMRDSDSYREMTTFILAKQNIYTL